MKLRRMKLKRTKMCQFLGHPVYPDVLKNKPVSTKIQIPMDVTVPT